MDKREPKCSAFEQALRFLDRKALSEKELTDKLKRFSYPSKEITEAVARCRERKFINDQLMIEDCRDALFARGNGSRLIKVKLLRRGLNGAEIAAQLADTADQEKAVCAAAAEAKLKTLVKESDPRKKREKLFRFLAARGFPPAVAGKTISELLNNSDIQ